MSAHRVAWFLFHNKEPEGEIDHINGVRSDNRICNLRDVDRKTNAKNHKVRKDNFSGIRGVDWHPLCNKWQVRIQVDGVRKVLGYFSDLEEAKQVKMDAELEAKFHKNNGRIS